MAIKHRKLFPPATNETTDCPGFCDPACPYNCYYPYDDPLFIPPPLPPPPPPPSPGKSLTFSPYLIILVGFLAASFLLVSYYVVIVKYCSGWNPFRRRRTTQQSQPPDEDEFIDQNQRTVIDHPIWYINTIGLQQSVINSISIFNYKKGDYLIEGKDCMVCLAEFQEYERLRLLPKCNHAFHINCIDTWLRSHTNCPLCRAPIVSNTGVSLPTNNDSSDLTRRDETQMENSERESEFGSTRVLEDRENRGETGDGDEEDDDDKKEMDVSSTRSSTLPNNFPTNPARLSELGVDQMHLSTGREMGCSSFRVESLKKKPVTIKRSISCGGRSLLPL